MNLRQPSTDISISDAGRLLDRAVPEDYLREWTEHVAAEKKTTQPGTRSVVIFRIGLAWLALPTHVLQEVAVKCALHRVPHTNGQILIGIVNIRGDLTLCVSLENLLGLGNQTETGKRTERTIYERFLVLNRQGDHLALPVSEVYGIAHYHPRELKELPSTLAKSAATYTIGILPWRDRTVGCLDDELVFYALNKGLS